MKEVRLMAAKKRTAADNVVWKQTAEEAALAKKPRYNGYACGHGAHGPTKYDRARAKRQWKAQLHQEGASRGSFRFPGPARQAAQGRSAACYNLRHLRTNTDRGATIHAY